ncbi:MAG: helix-turn-helix domain-containing protein [Gemmataceae bacterium]|nr:helix-turn-helix domain-containing protein [Gemmataceae bacterium]
MGTDEAAELSRDGAVGVPEACRFLGLSRTQVYELMAASELRYLKVGARRLLPRAELQRFLAARLAVN